MKRKNNKQGNWIVYICLVSIIFIFAILFNSKLAGMTALAKLDIENNDKLDKAIAKYVAENPEAIMKSLEDHHSAQMEQQTIGAVSYIKENRSKLENDKSNPRYGSNNKDSVKVIVFSDYNCGYCKKANVELEKLLKQDENVTVIIKEFPIFEKSDISAAASIVAYMIDKDKYQLVHNKIMQSSRITSVDQALNILAGSGIDKNKAKKMFASEEVKNIIKDNMELAKTLGINGTPAFIIGEEFIPGYVDITYLQKSVDKARGK